jgi:hypothetical protein
MGHIRRRECQHNRLNVVKDGSGWPDGHPEMYNMPPRRWPSSESAEISAD